MHKLCFFAIVLTLVALIDSVSHLSHFLEFCGSDQLDFCQIQLPQLVFKSSSLQEITTTTKQDKRPPVVLYGAYWLLIVNSVLSPFGVLSESERQNPSPFSTFCLSEYCLKVKGKIQIIQIIQLIQLSNYPIVKKLKKF